MIRAEDAGTAVAKVGFREEADNLITASQAEAAAAVLAELWSAEGATPGTASFLISRFERLRGKLPLLPYRMAILRSFTVEPVLPICRAEAFLGGIDLNLQVGDFNTYVQDIVDAQSSLYTFAPDVVILAVQSRDLSPRLWLDWTDLSESECKHEIESAVERFRGWVSTFRRNSSAHLVIHSLEGPVLSARGLLDVQQPLSQVAAFQQISRELGSITREYRGVYVLDYDELVARHGRFHWHDERKWLSVRLPFAAENMAHMAREWLRFLHPLAGRIAKAVAVDLDNTLWGGVIGEDGMTGIKLGGEYPGAAYLGFQRALLDLHRRGILLTICSKNNLDDAMEVLEKHPDMLVRPKHFAAMRINWNDKAQSLKEIAAELNVGIDAIALVDDNPVERKRVRAALPQVFVLEMPTDPMYYAQVLRDCPALERLTMSAEDLDRGEMYRAQRERASLEETATSREDFYRSLRQEAEVAKVTQATLARVAQLTQKTNQFNLTTRRYTEQQVSEMVTAPDWDVYSVKVRDRFGDNGLVGVAIIHREREVWQVDSFLLSCRVIGRTVETAFLAFLLEQAQAQGTKRVEGWFLPTRKNAPAKDFYPTHGFQKVKETEQGILWALTMPQNAVRCPGWIELKVNSENS